MLYCLFNICMRIFQKKSMFKSRIFFISIVNISLKYKKMSKPADIYYQLSFFKQLEAI